MEKKIKDQRVTILMSESELDVIDKWAHDNKIKSRGEAIRQLIDGAIAVLPAAKAVRNYVVHTGPDSASTTVALWNLVDAFVRITDESLFEREAESPLDGAYSFAGGDHEATMEVLDFLLHGKAKEPLAPREIFVVDRLAEGHDDEAIGNIVGLSARVVETYIKMLMEKAGARSRDDLIDTATLEVDMRKSPADFWGKK